MERNREYERLDQGAYDQGNEICEEGPRGEIKPPAGIEDLLGEIDKVVGKSNLSREYKQTGGQ
ncbi:hypothetical protein J4422_00835 [Candidatus Pacearchaeota archaeon]|nr:hypothetical protein [Candidatus Pacearchaeota archaeon]